MRKRIIKINDACISHTASAVGKEEALGPMGDCFDFCDRSDSFGADTWEKSESAMQTKVFELLMKKSGHGVDDFDALYAGDLQNQCVAASYGLLSFDVPYIGLYGACSTAAESMILASLAVSAKQMKRCGCVTSSHYLAAERQYRSPIEYGAQRAPTAQWTVTGAAGFCIENGSKGAKICEVMLGIVVDKGINDATNMGAAMAPAAADTLLAYFSESGRSPSDFDAIVTGDLGYEGGSILCELLHTEGLHIEKQYNDCGVLIYDRIRQDKHAGGSGCGCSAVVMASHFVPRLRDGKIKRMLFVGTGAMMSPSSVQQGLSIPSVAHLVMLEYGG